MIVATPVGFVKAVESRKRIREVAAEYDVAAIMNVGRRGGSGLAAALTNELIDVVKDVRTSVSSDGRTAWRAYDGSDRLACRR